MVLLQYVFFIFISRLRLDKWRWKKWLIVVLPISIFYTILLNKGLNHYILAGPPLFLLLSAVLFAKRGYVMSKVKAHKIGISLLAIASMAISQYLYCKGLYEIRKSLCIITFIAAGFFLFLLLSCHLNCRKERRIITALAGISYEVFLVHDPLLIVCNTYCNSALTMTIIWLSLTTITAILVKKATKRILSF